MIFNNFLTNKKQYGDKGFKSLPQIPILMIPKTRWRKP